MLAEMRKQIFTLNKTLQRKKIFYDYSFTIVGFYFKYTFCIQCYDNTISLSFIIITHHKNRIQSSFLSSVIK